jgi:hypothetical protein
MTQVTKSVLILTFVVLMGIATVAAILHGLFGVSLQ